MSSRPSRSAPPASTSAPTNRATGTRGSRSTTKAAPWRAAGSCERRPRIAALCELAEETAGGGDLDALRARLAELRETEAPDGIEAAEEAAAALEDAIEPAPRVATTAYLDALGVAARRLEQTLGEENGSPFAVALQQALPAIEELAAEVERTYKGPLA